MNAQNGIVKNIFSLVNADLEFENTDSQNYANIVKSNLDNATVQNVYSVRNRQEYNKF